MTLVWRSLAGRLGRGLGAAALALGLAVPEIPGPAKPYPLTIFLDRSLSMADEPLAAERQVLEGLMQTLPPESPVSLVAFAAEREILQENMPARDVGANAFLAELPGFDRAGSDLDTALRQRPDDVATSAGGVLVVSDGAVNITPRPEPRSMTWYRVEPDPPAADAAVLGIEAPVAVPLGETAAISVTLRGAHASEELAPVLELDGRKRAAMLVRTDEAARAIARFELKFDRAGLQTVTVRLPGGPHGMPGNDARSTVVDVFGPGEALYVATRPGSAPVLRALRGAGWRATVRAPAELPAEAEALLEYNLVVLDDVAVPDVPAAAWPALDTAVRGGGLGLLVLGGPNAFAGGGYLGSALEDLLPVVAEDATRGQARSVLFVVDKSGSMAQTDDGVRRLDAALGAADAALSGLAEDDRSGLILFDREASVAAGFSPGRQRFETEPGRLVVDPGGGTDILAALDLATALIDGETGRSRLIVLVTDGFETVDPGATEALRQRLRAADTAIVPILVGDDERPEFAEALSLLSGGTLLRAGRLAELPRLARSGVDLWAAPAREENAAVEQRHGLPWSGGPTVWPGVAGYMIARARRRATVLLRTDRGDPLLAIGHAAAGRVVAVTTDFRDWGAQWSAGAWWQDFVNGMAGWTAARMQDPRLDLRPRADATGLYLTIDALDIQGDWLAPEIAFVTVLRPDGRHSRHRVAPVAPGRYRLVLPAARAGLHMATVEFGQLVERHAFFVNAPELNAPLAPWRLGKLGNVHVLRPGDVLLPTDWPRAVVPVRGYLFAAALALFLAALVVERWPVGPFRKGRV